RRPACDRPARTCRTDMRFLIAAFLLLLSGCATIPRIPDPCALLTAEEIRAVQGEAPSQTKPSQQPSGELIFHQCFYTLPTFAKSVSLGVGVGAPEADAPREFWKEMFHEKKEEAEEGESHTPPRPVPNLGSEAYWIPLRIGATLYVLDRNAMLRISVGGNDSDAVRLEKSVALAKHVMVRLR
ncbi:MAG TPA: hypothetical protein VG323_01740, partial [Thermoanaerobaculia bacterium]|nr:hypothetical protein [Thermoanaerobaculia bacterium]